MERTCSRLASISPLYGASVADVPTRTISSAGARHQAGRVHRTTRGSRARRSASGIDFLEHRLLGVFDLIERHRHDRLAVRVHPEGAAADALEILELPEKIPDTLAAIAILAHNPGH